MGQRYGGGSSGQYGGAPGGLDNPAAVAITGGTSKLDDGAAATPSYSFANATGQGFYNDAADSGIGIAVAGTLRGVWNANGAYVNGAVSMGSAGNLNWSAGTFTATADTSLSRGGIGILQLSAGSLASEYRVSAGNGGFISNVKSVTESLTIAAAATTVGATSIPAGAILLAVSARVTTVIPTAATFTITTTVGGTTLNTAAVSSAANSTDPGTAAGASYRAAATTVTITPNLTPGTATGVVRLQYYYLQVTPPTS